VSRAGAATPPGGGRAPLVHHLIGASPYTTRFLRFLAAHPEAFPPAEHRFWIEHARGSSFRVEGGDAFVKTAIEPWGFRQMFAKLADGDRVVIHQLSNPRLLLHLFLHRRLARRCAWMIWGGDVYYFRYRPRTLPHAAREWLRRAVIPAIPLVGGLVPGDFEVVQQEYGTRARYVSAFYPLPMDDRALVPSQGPRGDGPVTVLVGNSGDPSNAHAEVLRALARFRGDGLRVLAPLAYGDHAYTKAVIALGHALFGGQFEPLTGFLPPEQYAERIRSVDAAIMNHAFQQGLGNVVALLLLGKKVYVRRETTTYGYFHDRGIRVFDTLALPALSLSELAAFPPEDGARNAAAVRELLSEANAVAGWRALFDALRSERNAGPVPV
jgi:hypothetical protein